MVKITKIEPYTIAINAAGDMRPTRQGDDLHGYLAVCHDNPFYTSFCMYPSTVKKYGLEPGQEIEFSDLWKIWSTQRD